METRETQKQMTPVKHSGEWGLKEMEADLLASGAKEITPEMQKQEPYKSIIAKIKYDLIHES